MKKGYLSFLFLSFFIFFKCYAAPSPYVTAPATGGWYNSSLWSRDDIPVPSNLQNGFSITISNGSDVTHTGSLTLGQKGDLIVNGVLIIDGDLTLSSNSLTNIKINTGGILIVTGSFNGNENNTSVNSGGYLVVGGNYNHNGGGTSSIENPGNIYTLGQVNSTLTNSGSINEGEDALRTGNPTLYEFVKTRTPSILPVTLLYFNATAQSSSVEIAWASSKAWDFSHYELERSSDGKIFEYLATIEADEFSDETVKYSYSDRQPLFGTSYYRLKAVDIDGAFEYKEVAVVKFGAESFSVYPNPATQGTVNISWSHATDGAGLELRDSTGRVVRKAVISGSNSSISTAGLSAGIYLLSVQSPAGIQQTQLLVR